MMQTIVKDRLSFEDAWELYSRIAWRQRWWLILPTVAIWSIVCVVTWFLPRQYRSETVILIEGPKIPEEYVLSNVGNDIQERLRNITQQILSRTRLLRVIEGSNLYPEQRQRMSPDKVVDLMRRDIKIELVQAPSRSQDVTAFKIYYSAHDPHTAQSVTGQLTRLFIDENLKARQQQSENTTEFLQSQLDSARESLSAQEAKVRDFKARYLGQLPAQLQPNLQIVSGLQTQLQAEVEALNRAKQQNLYLQSILTEYKAIQSELRLVATPEEGRASLDQELARLNVELANASAQYTPNHPEVKKLKQQIAATADLKRRVDAESPGSMEMQTPSSATRNNGKRLDGVAPILEIESQLKANQLEIRNREAQCKHISDQISVYQAKLTQVPLREQQLADLTRDYEQLRVYYESLLSKKNQSSMATNLERRQQGQQFQMLDPPSLPTKPDWPNFLMMSLVGFTIGATVSMSLVGFREVRTPHVNGESDLRSVLPCRVLGLVPKLLSDQEISVRHHRAVVRAATIAVVVLITIAITVLETWKQI